MHDDWSFIFSAPLRALSVCITAEKWTLATKDVHGRRVGERVEEYASKHKHSRGGIYSKRISHLIKTSPQLPGGLCHTKRLRVKFGVAPHLKISVHGGKKVHLLYPGFLKHFTCHNWTCFCCWELEIAIICVNVKGLGMNTCTENSQLARKKMRQWSTFAHLMYHLSLNSFSLTKEGIKDIKVTTDCHILTDCQVGN